MPNTLRWCRGADNSLGGGLLVWLPGFPADGRYPCSAGCSAPRPGSGCPTCRCAPERPAPAPARHALAAYLPLVRVTLAGGAGVEAALWDAAGQGGGPTFDRLRRVLFTAQLTRTTPWARLRQLGEELDIPELAELAASLTLAGTEGATVRASLAARAAALGRRGESQMGRCWCPGLSGRLARLVGSGRRVGCRVGATGLAGIRPRGGGAGFRRSRRGCSRWRPAA